jgi:hypothetical protein
MKKVFKIIIDRSQVKDDPNLIDALILAVRECEDMDQLTNELQKSLLGAGN